MIKKKLAILNLKYFKITVKFKIWTAIVNLSIFLFLQELEFCMLKRDQVIALTSSSLDSLNHVTNRYNILGHKVDHVCYLCVTSFKKLEKISFRILLKH